MAGTDRTKHAKLSRLKGPAIILVEPQLGENIGFAARAMLNCGLSDLRLVRPRDGWPNAKAVAAASGADQVIRTTKLFASVEAATADLQALYATSARPREMVKPVTTPRRAAAELRARSAKGERCGILFGPERMGLSNDQLALANVHVYVPLNPAFASLNLAQAVLIVGYEWWQAGSIHPARRLPTGRSARARRAELLGLFEHLERELDACGFLRNREKRPSVVRNLRNMMERAELTSQEVRTLRGVIANLVEPRAARAGSKAKGARPAAVSPRRIHHGDTEGTEAIQARRQGKDLIGDLFFIFSVSSATSVVKTAFSGGGPGCERIDNAFSAAILPRPSRESGLECPVRSAPRRGRTYRDNNKHNGK